jgi:hypothetical protein
VAPFSCMPGTITTAIFRAVSAQTGTPIVNLFYDGTGSQNRSLEVYLRTALTANDGGASGGVGGMDGATGAPLPGARGHV